MVDRAYGTPPTFLPLIMGGGIQVGGIFHVGPSYVSPSYQLRPPSLITTYHLTPPLIKPPNHSYIPPLRSDVTLHYLHYTSHSTTTLCLHTPLHCLHISPTSTYHLSKDMWQTTSSRTCGRPCQQGHVAVICILRGEVKFET
jgi:hypothetical protein